MASHGIMNLNQIYQMRENKPSRTKIKVQPDQYRKRNILQIQLQCCPFHVIIFSAV